MPSSRAIADRFIPLDARWWMSVKRVCISPRVCALALSRSSRPEQLFSLLERAGFDVPVEQAAGAKLRVAEA